MGCFPGLTCHSPGCQSPASIHTGVTRVAANKRSVTRVCLGSVFVCCVRVLFVMGMCLCQLTNLGKVNAASHETGT